MKKFFTLFVFSFFSLSISAYSQNIIARWNFEVLDFASTAGSTFTPTAGTVVADSGAQVTGSAFSALHASAATVWSTPAGNGSANSASSTAWAAGDYWQFQVNTTGYNGIFITFDQQSSNTGPKSFIVQYSTNGTNFTDVPSNITNSTFDIANDSWNATTYRPVSTRSLDLTSITALNNAPAVYFRIAVASGSLAVNNSAIATGGTSRIDNFIVSDGSLLPLSLISFNASLVSREVSLFWNTTNEINVDGFAIEKSNDGRTFNKIGFVNAKNTNAASYSFSDVLNNNVSYYRLKMIDKDGSFKYSSVVVLTAKQTTKLDVFPNPIVNTATLTHEVAGTKANIKVVTMDGKNVFTQNIQTGATQTSFDVSKLLKGNYLIVFENEGNRSTIQFVKQ